MKNYIKNSFLPMVLVLGLPAVLGACQAKQVTTPNHLIMLTEAPGEAPGGGADASFMTVTTLEECETRATAAKTVFPVAGIKYIAHYCVDSQVSFEPFLHNDVPTGPNYIFNLHFTKDAKGLNKATPYPSMDACKKANGEVCVISYQNML